MTVLYFCNIYLIFSFCHSFANQTGPTGRTCWTENRLGIWSGHSLKAAFLKIENEPFWTAQKLPNRTGSSGWVVYFFQTKKKKPTQTAPFWSILKIKKKKERKKKVNSKGSCGEWEPKPKASTAPSSISTVHTSCLHLASIASSSINHSPHRAIHHSTHSDVT